MILKLKFISILTIILLFSSCAKEEIDCKSNLYGTYSGTQSCIDGTSNAYTYQSSLMLSESVQENKIVVTISGTSFAADVSSDCSSITIPSQLVSGGSSGSSTINGSFIVNGASLSGNLTVTDNGSSVYNNNCTFNLSRL